MKRCIFLLLCLPLLSCQKKHPETEGQTGRDGMHTDSIYYARGFRIESYDDFKLVSIENPWHTNKRLQNYLLIPKNRDVPANLPEGIVVRTPLERTVVFSSVVCSILNELGALPALTGVAEPEYVDIPAVQTGIADGTIQNIGQASHPDIEQLILLAPEAMITNPVNEAGAGSLGKLTAPAIPCLEWMENHPLGQTEWIRLFGLLFDKQALADSLFLATVRSYNDLKRLTDTVSVRPSVFTEKKYGDFWYMPGGKSYFAYFLQDAGANYVFGDNTETGSVPFAFETILDRAGQADYWLFKYYSPREITYRQLAAEYANYTLFDAFKNRTVFACNTLKTAYYYQDLPLHPDWILRDLIAVFHPDLLPWYRMRYYFRITE
ncbi:MAG: ABC transporter substrate-binding protein [Dysgonamonadaceae bacterium]|jgi:iron complex transport system substrate-binding protein|nr:ABC transporter substrate-binding protein [Dysgonamonadaceae bacterium]